MTQAAEIAERRFVMLTWTETLAQNPVATSESPHYPVTSSQQLFVELLKIERLVFERKPSF